MIIIPATPEDHQVLTDLTIKSKSYWDYSSEQIKEWLPDLTISPDYIAQNGVFKLIQDEQVIAYYSYYYVKKEEVFLDNFFISPEFIGKGFGRMLMDHLLKHAATENIKSVEGYADPNAELFYAKFGFETIRRMPTSIKNRFLPVMRKNFK